MGINVYEKGLEVMLLCSLPVQHSHDKIILAVQEIHSIPPTLNMSSSKIVHHLVYLAVTNRFQKRNTSYRQVALFI